MTRSPATSPPEAAIQADPAGLVRLLLSGFRGPIQRPRTSPLYRLGLAAVAIAMVVLPVLYVAIAAIAAWGVIALDRAIVDAELTGRALVLSLLAVNVGGGVTVFFMFKPLFAPRPDVPQPHVLDRLEEPAVFAFVDHLCGVVGAPRPRQIELTNDVNAAASFESGLASVAALRLKLTIGLPLVAGMALREFTGVLAHEFGHFSQGTGMRLTYLIRSVNVWFARVVYERDSWDESLGEWASSGSLYSVLIANVARGAVWVTRRILWALMMFGHVISCFMLRQMEYDADACETQVSGSAAFESAMLRVSQLAVASSVSHGQLSETWKTGKLVDDLPALIVARADGFDAGTLENIRSHAFSQTTGKLDTHPSHADRIEAARRLAAPGVFDLDAPAGVLFLQFDALARDVTKAYYARMMGEVAESAELQSVGELQAGTQADSEAAAALREVFGPALVANRVMAMGALQPQLIEPQDQAAAIAALGDCIRQMHEIAASAQSSMKYFVQFDEQLAELDQKIGAEEIYFAARFGGANLPSLQAQHRQMTQEARLAAVAYDKYLQAGARRLELGVVLARAVAAEAAPEGVSIDAAEIEPVLAAMAALQSQEENVYALRTGLYRLHGALVDVSQSNRGNQDTINAIQNATRVLANKLGQLKTALTAPYPFEHAAKTWSVGDYLLERRPSADDIGQVVQATHLALNRTIETYLRLLAHVCRFSRRVERALVPDAPPHPLLQAEPLSRSV